MNSRPVREGSYSEIQNTVGQGSSWTATGEYRVASEVPEAYYGFGAHFTRWEEVIFSELTVALN